jgi:hypothetical protein
MAVLNTTSPPHSPGPVKDRPHKTKPSSKASNVFKDYYLEILGFSSKYIIARSCRGDFFHQGRSRRFPLAIPPPGKFRWVKLVQLRGRITFSSGKFARLSIIRRSVFKIRKTFESSFMKKVTAAFRKKAARLPHNFR